MRERRERAPAVVRLRLDHRVLQRLRELLVVFGAQLVDHRTRVEPRVPDVEVAHRRELPHRVAIGAGDSGDGGGALAGAEAAVPRRDLEAGRETFHVPFERPCKCLVEVVEVEDESALRRREAAEVHQVRVTGELRAQRRSRRRRKIVRHHGCRTAEERERRGEHSAVANRNELGDSRRVLRLEERERISVCRELERRVARPRHLYPGGAPAGGAIRDGRRRRDRLSGVHPSILPRDTLGCADGSRRSRRRSPVLPTPRLRFPANMRSMSVDSKHRDTLEKILRHPASGNVEWRQVRSLLEAVGDVVEQHDGKLKVTLGDETEVLQRPHGKDVDTQMIVDLRRMLTRAGIA